WDAPAGGYPYERLLDLLHGRRRSDVVHVDPLGRILSRVAGGAEGEFLALTARFLQSFERKIGERVGSDVLADLFHALVGGDELVLRRRVHTVEAGRDGRWARDAHVHLFGPRVAHHADDLTAGGAAHDGVVDQHHALALEQRAHRVQLELHSE